ncbi:MAG: hypothetical protein ABSA40_02745 [Candidatus Dormibacteria bacterium]
MAFPITTELIAAQARRLGEGDHRYTVRQLYYASCAAADRPPPSAARGLTGCGVLLLLLAAALLWVHSAALTAALAALGVVALAAALASAIRERRRVPGSRPLAESYDGFREGPLRRALTVRPEAFSAMLAPAQPATSGPGDPLQGGAAPPGAGALVACDRSETALLLTGNAAHLPAVRVVTVDPAGGAAAPAGLVAGRRIVALHDADPRGCDLPARLRRDGALEVIDAGLSPPPSDAGLQVIEGAPARLPEGLEAELAADQVHWLRSGRRMELATLTPREVLARVVAALEGAA